MSQDDWNNPNQKSPNQAPNLPGPGQGWDDLDEPKPLHNIADDEWGTAQPGPSPQRSPQGPGGYSQPGYDGSATPGVAPGTGGRRKPGSGGGQGWDDGPYNQGAGYQPPGPGYQQPGPGPGYGPGPGGPMMHQPQHHMQRAPVQLDGNDIAAIILSGFVPGVGHMMLGQTVKGAVILGATILTCGMGYILAMLICVDAYYVARARKYRPVGEWEFLPPA